MNFSTKLTIEGEQLENPTHYRKLISKLIYLTNTRPDITYAVNTLSQYISTTTKAH